MRLTYIKFSFISHIVREENFNLPWIKRMYMPKQLEILSAQVVNKVLIFLLRDWSWKLKAYKINLLFKIPLLLLFRYLKYNNRRSSYRVVLTLASYWGRRGSSSSNFVKSHSHAITACFLFQSSRKTTAEIDMFGGYWLYFK